VVPRDPALGGIAEAFDERSVETITAAQLGLDPDRIGEAGSPTRVRSMKTVEKERTCRRIEGTPQEQADALVQQLMAAGLIG
jgi:electron transfer flavoprotein beta subunit